MVRIDAYAVQIGKSEGSSLQYTTFRLNGNSFLTGTDDFCRSPPCIKEEVKVTQSNGYLRICRYVKHANDYVSLLNTNKNMH